MKMKFEREGGAAIVEPSAKRIALEIRRLKSYGKSSFASLTRADGSYVQVAGGGVGCLVERRETGPLAGLHAEADRLLCRRDRLVFGGGRIALLRDEWIRAEMVVGIFEAFRVGGPFPTEIGWRDVSAAIGL